MTLDVSTTVEYHNCDRGDSRTEFADSPLNYALDLDLIAPGRAPLLPTEVLGARLLLKSDIFYAILGLKQKVSKKLR